MNPFAPSPRDWPEDSEHENGSYQCRCVHCHTPFIGHKRRVVCHVCHDRDEAEAKRRAEWLHAHSAPSNWVVLTSEEVAAMKGDLMKLVWDKAELRRSIQSVIDSACHPDIALRVMLVPLAPLREVLAKTADPA